MTEAPRGTSACWRLFSGMVRPRVSNILRIVATSCSSRSSSTFITSASAALVMSSWVGPSPADDHRVTTRQRGAKGQDDPLVIVAHVLVEVRRDTIRRELLTQPLRVGVGNLAEQ